MVCGHLQFIHPVRTNSGTNVCVRTLWMWPIAETFSCRLAHTPEHKPHITTMPHLRPVNPAWIMLINNLWVSLYFHVAFFLFNCAPAISSNLNVQISLAQTADLSTNIARRRQAVDQQCTIAWLLLPGLSQMQLGWIGCIILSALNPIWIHIPCLYTLHNKLQVTMQS